MPEQVTDHTMITKTYTYYTLVTDLHEDVLNGNTKSHLHKMAQDAGYPDLRTFLNIKELWDNDCGAVKKKLAAIRFGHNQ